MSWCNKLASVPSAGFLVDFFAASGDRLLDSLSPLINRLFLEQKLEITIERHESFALTFSTPDGFHYALEPTKVAVTFKHNMKAKAISGAPPTMELLSRPAPYTELLDSCLEKLADIALLLPDANKRNIQRFGIVSQTKVADDEMPPGIKRYIEYVGRPWQNLDRLYALSVTAKLGEKDGTSDRCIHNIVQPEGEDTLVNMSFDWQRYYSAGKPINAEPMRDIIRTGRDGALRYFEDLAEGSRFDEKLRAESA